MNLHEYQAKELFREYGITVPMGYVASTPQEAREAYQKLGVNVAVVKAQIHAGARGKAGGVKVCKTIEAVEEATNKMLGTRLVTHQTDAKGLPVSKVYIEAGSNIVRELYLGAVVDRATQRIVFMASTEGGVEIETVAEQTPEKILTTTVDPLVGLQGFQARELAFKLGLVDKQVNKFASIMLGLAKLVEKFDFALLEINPLVVTAEGDLFCLDGKVNIDPNALYRQPRLREMRDTSQEEELENRAVQHELNYVALDGDIGCMVNGAGLAMGTMDLVKFHGGSPANFLDVGGGATKERVIEAFKIILSVPTVKAILVNIFGGIVSCEMIAQAIIAAAQEVKIKVPVVVRLEGNKADLGAKVLSESGLNIIAAKSLKDAADQVVLAAKKGA